ncbi:CHASE2 domain-containing protein [Elusimicrobiota bacterium]
MKKNRILLLLSVGISLLVVLFSILNIGKGLELKSLDLRFIIRGPNPLSDKVFLVAIDDESISPKVLGRWPWRRAYMALFVDMMMPYELDALVFDILFTEPSEDFPEDDLMLAEQAALMKKSFFPFFCIPETTKKSRGYSENLNPIDKKIIEKISFGKASNFKKPHFIKARNLVMPISLLGSSARSTGYVNASPDRDGITRRIPLVMQYKDYIVPNVAFEVVLKSLGVKREAIKIFPGKYIIIKNDERVIKIPVDRKCRMLVNHAGDFTSENIPSATFVGITSSNEAIISGEKPPVDLRKLKDKIVFLGLTATGTSDLNPTPFTPIFPMVGFLTTASSNILREDFLTSAPGWLNWLLIMLTGLFASSLTIRFRAIPSAVLNIVFMAVYFVISYAFFRNNYVINTFYPFLSVGLSYAGITVYRFTGEEQDKKAIRHMFQRYVSSQVVDVLLSHPGDIKLGGERKRLTVFFSDIRGFTTISEDMPPEGVVSILNEYLNEMIDIIFKYQGTLDKFIGDAIMAVWGAPVEQKNHAELAMRAAIEMQEKLTELQEQWEKEGKKKIYVGMGLNTGDVVVGNMGSDQFADYTVIGDNVNLSARLEEIAGKGQILITEATYQEVKDIIEVKKLEPLKVKGREKAVQVYEVEGLKKRKKGLVY